jgi:HlyD family secretion protein
MKKKIIFSFILLIVTLGIGGTILSSMNGNGESRYQFAEIVRGDLESTISSSGTLSPVTTVEVGTQVSGTIARIFVDFNDPVKKGQLLTVLDTVLLKASLLDAQATLEKARAQLEEALAGYERNKSLFEKELISEAEFLPFQINLKMQRASLKSATAALQRAEQNLMYAYIYSPINGTVIQRNVEAGQTVAASLSAPILFEIAEDLSQMEILAEVDESDIGLIKEGQAVRFDVQAYSDKIFSGTVRQIRLQPEIISNVVTYTVVVDAANEENLLLPGMTATVDFIIEQKKDALLVPNTALRFQPLEEMIAEFRERRQKEFAALPDSVKERVSARMASGGAFDKRQSGSGRSAGNFKQIWYLDKDGRLAMEPVRIGMSDGLNSEIVRSRNLEEGMQVIVGTELTNMAANKSVDNSNKGFMPGRSRPF